MAYRKFEDVKDVTGAVRTVRSVDAREIEAIAKGESPAVAHVEAKADAGQAEPKTATAKELSANHSREQLNGMASELGLEPSDYSKKDDIAEAIADATAHE